jgi:hypothetical protein
MMIDQGIAIAGVRTIFGALRAAASRLNRKIGLVGFGLGVLLLGIAGSMSLLSGGNAQPPPIDNQGTGSAYSFGPKGGITAGRVNGGSRKRSLSDPTFEGLKLQMLSELPRDEPITVMAVLGDRESIDFAQEIHTFLKKNEFMLKQPDRISQAIFADSPKGVGLRKEPNGELTLIVGAAW